MRPVWVALKCHCKHSIASEEYGINQVTFALQNIKIRLWQAVMNWILSISHEQSKLAFKLSSEEFSCQRVQSQTCLSYAECSRKSHVCKMYVMVNKQVKILTAFPSSQMNRAKFAYAMSWRGNVSNSIYRHS